MRHGAVKQAKALDRGRNMSYRRGRQSLRINMFPMEHLIDKPFRANVLQVRHLERRVAEKGDVHLRALLGVEVALYAVVHKSHEAGGYYDTVHDVSWLMQVADVVALLTQRCRSRNPGCARR